MEELSAIQKNFLLRTIKFLIEEGQISQGRQLLLRYIGSTTFADEDYALVDKWTDDYLNSPVEEE